MNTNSYLTRNDDTWGVASSITLVFTISFILGTKILFAQSSIPSSDTLPIEVISGESPFAENSQWQQLSGGHAGCEGAQWEIQKVAEACLEIATDLFPETVGAYRRIRGE